MPFRTSYDMCRASQTRALNLHEMTNEGKHDPAECTEVLELSGNLAPGVGIEPTTNGLTVRRSTAELPGNITGAREGRGLSRNEGAAVKETPCVHNTQNSPRGCRCPQALRVSSWID